MQIQKLKTLALILSVLSALFCGESGIYAAWVGLDTNAPIDAVSGNIAAPVQVVADTGTDYVRVNFILGPWSSPDDSTPHGSGNKTWYQTYDEIIDGFISRGVKVYALVGAEAVHSGASSPNSDQYVDDYAANFEKIVGHFKDRIRIYESFNEPNDWAGGTTAQVQPLWFAKMLEQIYRKVKINNGHSSDSTWQVTLVSGPLFSHDLDNVAAYFAQVYSNGIASPGWTDLKTNYGTYPLDGIGYHIYVAQGATDLATIQTKMLGNMDAIWNTIKSYEGAGTTKKLWVSEFGWNSYYTEIGEAGQAGNLEKSFNILLNDNRVQLAVWFCLKGFGTGEWGIFRASGLSNSDKKPSWFSFNAIAIANKTPLGASIVSHNIPDEMAAGETKSITIRVKNTGGQTWSGTGAANLYRLAAANSSASAGALNEFTWSAFSSGGFFTSAIDAQAYLSGSVTTSSEIDITFSITAPSNSGGFAFAAKMIKSGASEFFGDALTKYIFVRKGSDNALSNAGFESGNISKWTEFASTDGAISGSWFAGITAQDGNYFLGSAANYGTKSGGVYQQVDVSGNNTYAAKVFVRTYKEGTGESSCRIGIDPQGGTDSSASSIIWSGWKINQGTWTPLYAFAKPAGAKISLFLQGKQGATIWNITCFDTCILVPQANSQIGNWIMLE